MDNEKMPYYLGIGGGAAVILGSFLPWAEVLGITVSGFDGDGVLTLILGLVGAGVAFMAMTRPVARWLLIVGAVAFVAAFLIFIVDYLDVTDVPTASVGIGLWLVAIGSIVGGVGAVMMLRAPADAAPPASTE